MIIKKVWKVKSTGTKYITVPKNCDINTGDFVELVKIEKTKNELKINKDIKELKEKIDKMSERKERDLEIDKLLNIDEFWKECE